MNTGNIPGGHIQYAFQCVPHSPPPVGLWSTKWPTQEFGIGKARIQLACIHNLQSCKIFAKPNWVIHEIAKAAISQIAIIAKIANRKIEKVTKIANIFGRFFTFFAKSLEFISRASEYSANVSKLRGQKNLDLFSATFTIVLM